MQQHLIIDSHFLLWRAFHSGAGGLENGTTFGFLRDIAALEELFNPAITIFAFDAGGSKRAEIYPEYKANRKQKQQELTEDELAEHTEFYKQVDALPKHLKTIGYKNVFSQRGYEGDDIIAEVAGRAPVNVDAIIVSADKDLWQLLRIGVRCYNPITRNMTTLELFRKEWGIAPSQWADVKAWAGCVSDNVEGVRGIGEKKAAAWIKGKLKPESVAYKAIFDNLEVYTRNIKLVRLPFEGCGPFTIKDDLVLDDKREAVYAALGFPSLQKRRPRGVKPRGDSVGFGFGGP